MKATVPKGLNTQSSAAQINNGIAAAGTTTQSSMGTTGKPIAIQKK
jgi:hypothetical protein